MRDSIVFYKSWLDAIKNLPREIQGEVFTAIIEYGLSGITTESLKPITKAMLAIVKPQIDANNVKYENGKKGAKYGNKGGRPKKENPNETPTKPQENPNETPNVYVYDNVNNNPSIISLIPERENYVEIEKFASDVIGNDLRIEEIRRGVKINGEYAAKEQVISLLKAFSDIQVASGNSKNTDKEYRRHFINWAKTNSKSEDNENKRITTRL